MTDRTEYYKKYRSRVDIKERQRQHQQNWRDRNPNGSLALTRKNRDKHRIAFNKQATEKRLQESKELADNYIKSRIRHQTNFILPIENIPTELMELERIRLFTQRKLKNKTKWKSQRQLHALTK